MYDTGCVYFCCDECPICEGFDLRARLAKEHGDDIQFDHCGCDKINNEFFAGGYCEDAFAQKVGHDNSNRRQTGRAYRREMSERKRDRLMKIVTHGYKPNVGWVDYDFVDDMLVPVGKYVKRAGPSGWQRYLKRASNRAIRRQKDLPTGKGAHHKCFEYKWMIY